MGVGAMKAYDVQQKPGRVEEDLILLPLQEGQGPLLSPDSTMWQSGTSSSSSSSGRPEVVVMTKEEWMTAAQLHRERVLGLLGRRGADKGGNNSNKKAMTVPPPPKHPVFNFLYEYYHFKPTTLLSWTPGLVPFPLLLQDALPSQKLNTSSSSRRRVSRHDDDGGGGGANVLAKRGVPVRLSRREEEEVVVGTLFFPVGNNGGVESSVLSRHRQALEKGREILYETLGRSPGLHCFGVHEWALLYWTGGELGPKGLGQGPGGGLGQGPGRADRIGATGTSLKRGRGEGVATDHRKH